VTTVFTIAHLTDVHLGPIEGFTPSYWSVKRALGYLNWQHQRKSAHVRSVLDRLIADLRANAPDHIAVTGDLVNIGLPREHINALAWLTALGPPERVTVVPGNHDIYAHLSNDPGAMRWQEYMTSDAHGLALIGDAKDPFPFVRRVGEVAIVGLNSAVETPPLIASGRLGQRQLLRAADLLDRLANQGHFRLVLIHHPPLPGQASRARGLVDAAALEQVLLRHGAELVIHGHNHLNMRTWCTGPRGPFPVIGAPSASLGHSHMREELARYNLYRLGMGTNGTSIEMIGRGLDAPEGSVVELERRILRPDEKLNPGSGSRFDSAYGS
jgi:3',5'-cyclic AMP phosphodiesterase CpdA